MLHSLNALRVIAEFWVVRLHLLGLVQGEGVGVWVDVFTHDLLSFFFVLSGFVAGYSHRGVTGMDWAESRRYWLTRWCKTYPVYAVWVTVNLVGTIGRGGMSMACSWFWPCVVGDYVLVSPWMFCESIEGPGVAWYLTTLYWMWLVFPFVHRLRVGEWLRANPWSGIVGLYVLSLPPWIIGVLYPSAAGGGSPTNNLSRVPAFRVCEFLMGYCAAFSERKIPVYWPVAGVLMCVGLYAFDALVTHDYTVCVTLAGPSECYLWGPRAPAVVSCVPVWNQFWSRTSLVWAVVIAYCAEWETRVGIDEIPVLGYNAWKSMSAFSLQMYLGHFSVGAVLVRAAELVTGMRNCVWQIDTLLIACYFACYSFYRRVQPVMDKYARRLCGLDGEACCAALVTESCFTDTIVTSVDSENSKLLLHSVDKWLDPPAIVEIGGKA